MKTFLRILIFIIGAISFVMFTYPLFRAVHNIGNYTGIVISVLLLTYAITFKDFNKLVGKIWKKKLGKFFLILILIFGGVIFILAIITTSLMISGGRKNVPEGAVLIVLGGQVKGTEPSLTLLRRLTTAKEYLDEHPDMICIVSGGKGKGEDISEAECMSRWLISQGVPEDRIYKEDKSTDTDENIRFSKDIMVREGLGNSLAITTSDFHEYRAGKIAEKYGLEYGSVPSRTVWWLIPTFWMREMYGILAEAVGI
ncbi:MAG: YdcF family protein [Eubacterium sp.]|nr:YdcF family protein [Eubacterium sp.]